MTKKKTVKKTEATSIVTYKSNMLLKLVQEHKKSCSDPHCDISTFLVYSTFYKPFLTENGYAVKAADDFKLFL